MPLPPLAPLQGLLPPAGHTLGQVSNTRDPRLSLQPSVGACFRGFRLWAVMEPYMFLGLEPGLEPCGERLVRDVVSGHGAPLSCALVSTTASEVIRHEGLECVLSYTVLHTHVKQIWEPASVRPIMLLLCKVFIKF